MFDLDTQRLRNIEAVLKHQAALSLPYPIENGDLEDDASFTLILALLPLTPDHDEKLREWRMSKGEHPYCLVVTDENRQAFRQFLQNKRIYTPQLGLSACEKGARLVCNVWTRPISTSGERRVSHLPG